jgi:hypothetical protein
VILYQLAGAPSSIPFKEAAAGGSPSVAIAWIVTVVLLSGVFLFLFIARRRGWAWPQRGSASPSGGGRLVVVQSLRLSPTCMAFLMSRGGQELVIVESRHNLHVSSLANDPPAPPAQPPANGGSHA